MNKADRIIPSAFASLLAVGLAAGAS